MSADVIIAGGRIFRGLARDGRGGFAEAIAIQGSRILAVGDAASDIQQALLALGYNEKDAAAALKALPAGVGVSDGIKLALKSLAK